MVMPAALSALAAASMVASCEPEAMAAAVVLGAADQDRSGVRPAVMSGATRLDQLLKSHGTYEWSMETCSPSFCSSVVIPPVSFGKAPTLALAAAVAGAASAASATAAMSVRRSMLE